MECVIISLATVIILLKKTSIDQFKIFKNFQNILTKSHFGSRKQFLDQKIFFLNIQKKVILSPEKNFWTKKIFFKTY